MNLIFASKILFCIVHCICYILVYAPNNKLKIYAVNIYVNIITFVILKTVKIYPIIVKVSQLRYKSEQLICVAYIIL